jgi:hypothetical protein
MTLVNQSCHDSRSLRLAPSARQRGSSPALNQGHYVSSARTPDADQTGMWQVRCRIQAVPQAPGAAHRCALRDSARADTLAPVLTVVILSFPQTLFKVESIAKTGMVAYQDVPRTLSPGATALRISGPGQC